MPTLPILALRVLTIRLITGVPDTGLDSGFYLPSRNTGQIELHGRKRLRTWTKLRQTAHAGDNFFVTSERVDFAPGENLVLPGTEVPSNIFSPEGFGIDQVRDPKTTKLLVRCQF